MSIGIYIHIPFCKGKCNYCHFVRVPFHSSTVDIYEAALIKEIEIYSAACAHCEDVDSIYFGGGTPSLLSAEHMANILDTCRRRFPLSDDCEISLEANPGSLSYAKAAAYIQSGINRISLGAQSFTNAELISVGRLHSAEMIWESLGQLGKAGYSNINLDLLLGLPRQTAQSWNENLGKAIRSGVPHISVYMLEMDEPCELKSAIAEGRTKIPADDLVADIYLEAVAYLLARGFEQYEISNFARSGYCCRHNLKYWLRKPVLGFGLGSHSFDGQSRYANTAIMEEYLHDLESGHLPVKWRQAVSQDQALEESLFLGLRLNEGVNWRQLQGLDKGGRMAKYEQSLRRLSRCGLIEWKDAVVRLTPSGMLLSNEIFQLFV